MANNDKNAGSHALNANLNRIQRFFERTRSGYAFACADNQQLIEPVFEDMIKRLHAIPVATATLELTDEPIVAQLQNAAQQSSAKGLLINTEAAFSSTSANSLTDKQNTLILELNFSREALLSLNIPLLFRVNRPVLSLISNHASDFFAQRSINTVFFEPIPEIEIPDPKHYFAIDYWNQPADTDAHKSKIELLQQQLQAAHKKRFSEDEIARNIALPLALAFAQANRVTDASRIINTYKARFNMEGLKTMFDLGDIAFKTGNNEEARQYYCHALDIARKTGDWEAEVSANKRIGYLDLIGNDIELAVKHFEMVISLIEALEDKSGTRTRETLAIAYYSLSLAHKALGNEAQRQLCLTRWKELLDNLLEQYPLSRKYRDWAKAAS